MTSEESRAEFVIFGRGVLAGILKRRSESQSRSLWDEKLCHLSLLTGISGSVISHTFFPWNRLRFSHSSVRVNIYRDLLYRARNPCAVFVSVSTVYACLRLASDAAGVVNVSVFSVYFYLIRIIMSFIRQVCTNVQEKKKSIYIYLFIA